MMVDYDKLFNFLGGWFPDMDLEGVTEKEIIENYKATVSKEELEEVVFEAEQVRDNIEQYLKVVEKETNLYFNNPSEASSWLALVINLLKKW